MLHEIIPAHPWLTLLLVFIIFQSIRAIYRITLHPLSSFPGPKLAAISRWYEVYYEIILGGRFAQQVDKIHQQYGPIVRINPFEIHINDPEFYDRLYNFDLHLEKRDYHIQNVQHTGPHNSHKPLRRALAPHLTAAAITKVEPLITLNINYLCQRLSEAQASAEPISLSHLYRCMTADIISTYTFGKSYHLLQKPKESETFLTAFAFTFRLLWLVREIPYLSETIRWLGIIVGRAMTSSALIPTLLRWQWEIATQLQTLQTTPSAHPSLLSSYIHTPALPPAAKTGQALHDTAIMLLAAGFETTGFALTTATYHILSTPSVHTALQSSNDHTYLGAIIKEALRLSLGAGTRLPRINHHSCIQYKQWSIPPGTPVGMTHACLHYDPKIFPDPKRFVPERWLGCGEEQRRRMERSLVPFSRGARGCLGVHLAHAELEMCLSTVFSKFPDLKLWRTERRDVEPARDFFVPVTEVGSRGLRVLVGGMDGLGREDKGMEGNAGGKELD